MSEVHDIRATEGLAIVASLPRRRGARLAHAGDPEWLPVSSICTSARKRTPRKPHFASEHDGSSLLGNVLPGVLHTVHLQPFAIQKRDDAALFAQLDRGTGQSH